MSVHRRGLSMQLFRLPTLSFHCPTGSFILFAALAAGNSACSGGDFGVSTNSCAVPTGGCSHSDASADGSDARNDSRLPGNDEGVADAAGGDASDSDVLVGRDTSVEPSDADLGPHCTIATTYPVSVSLGNFKGGVQCARDPFLQTVWIDSTGKLTVKYVDNSHVTFEAVGCAIASSIKNAYGELCTVTVECPLGSFTDTFVYDWTGVDGKYTRSSSTCSSVADASFAR